MPETNSKTSSAINHSFDILRKYSIFKAINFAKC